MQPSLQKYDLLVVDDDQRLRQLLSEYLHEQNFNVVTAPSAKEARELLNTFIFDLVVLDVMMPGETGLELMQFLRQANHTFPILLLTARGDVEARIEGLESGADEYLPKPFDPKELVLRIHAILRRNRQPSHAEEIAFGPFYFDMKKQHLRHHNTPVSLTDIEARLLKAFLEHVGESLSRDQLMELMGQQSPRTVDVLVTRLRKKIEIGGKPFIQTVRNIGYIFWTH
jgi:two-component system phosphate regulon response regulator OmpR